MEVTYENSITNDSKAMVNVKVFADKQTDGQLKNYMPLIYPWGGA